MISWSFILSELASEVTEYSRFEGRINPIDPDPRTGPGWGGSRLFADGAEQGGDAGRVLAPRRRFDAAGDVDHPGAEACQAGGDVLRGQATGQDQAGQGGERIEEVGGDQVAGPTRLARDIGVDQDGVGEPAE